MLHALHLLTNVLLYLLYWCHNWYKSANTDVLLTSGEALVKPEYAACIAVVTKASLVEIIGPACLVLSLLALLVCLILSLLSLLDYAACLAIATKSTLVEKIGPACLVNPRVCLPCFTCC